MFERQGKPFHTESIRIDIEYFRNGEYNYRIMRPDRRKRNQKNWHKKIKWEWAIGSGYFGKFTEWDDIAMREGSLGVRGRLPGVVSALLGHFQHLKRCLLHDLEEPANCPWLKRPRKLRGTDSSDSPDGQEQGKGGN